MNFADQYLAKHYEKIISAPCPPGKDLAIIVIIPAFCEPGIFSTLKSLYDCFPPQGEVEVMILVNWPENANETVKQDNLNIYHSLEVWTQRYNSDHIKFYPMLYPDMPAKQAGVGLARKTLMDEAVRRFNLIARSNGIIASLDADTLCKNNYLRELEKHFMQHPSIDGCTICFEHPLHGDEFPQAVYDAICLYELHLRYYLQSIRYTGFRYAYHTVGSSFAVTAGAYCRQGGMNKRKAGEDFYFLQKFFMLGNFTELKSTCTIPSPRPSSRVPFGTGKIISEFEAGKRSDVLTYNPDLFDFLTTLFKKIPGFYNKVEALNLDKILADLPMSLKEFLIREEFCEALPEIIANSSSCISFEKRFFRWFNLFRLLKFLNYGRAWYKDIPVTDAASILLEKKGVTLFQQINPFELLYIYRNLEKDGDKQV